MTKGEDVWSSEDHSISLVSSMSDVVAEVLFVSARSSLWAPYLILRYLWNRHEPIFWNTNFCQVRVAPGSGALAITYQWWCVKHRYAQSSHEVGVWSACCMEWQWLWGPGWLLYCSSVNFGAWDAGMHEDIRLWVHAEWPKNWNLEDMWAHSDLWVVSKVWAQISCKYGIWG